MFKRLRTRLIVAILTLVVTPGVLAGFVVGLVLFNAQETSAIKQQSLLVAHVGGDVQQYIGNREQSLRALLRVNTLFSLPADKQQQLVGSTLSADEANDDLTLVDGSGIVLAQASRRAVVNPGSMSSFAQTDAFPLLQKSNETYFSPVSFNTDTGEPYIILAVPFQNLQTGGFAGALVATVRFKPVWDLLNNYGLDPSEQLYIVDQSNRVIAHRNSSVVLRGTKFTVPVDGVDVTGLTGEQVVLTTQNIAFGTQAFKVVVELPRNIALQDAQQLLLALFGIFLVSIVVASAVGVVLANQITRPVENLSGFAKQLARGDYSQQATVGSADEIGQLAQTFNALASAIQKRESELREQANELRIASAEAREANRLKDEFLAVMSHELRTPLNAIIGFTGILTMSKSLDASVIHKLRRIRANGERLLALINDILDISRIESGRMVVVNAPFPIRQLVEKLDSQMNVLAEEKSLAFNVQVDDSVPPILDGDQDAITKIITNLLSNAFKFTEKGEVSLKVGWQDNQLVIEAKDTGIGIPAHMYELIFETFRQADSSTTRKYGGSGLGLSIVRHLCNTFNGTVQVSSVVGEGSLFTVKLPMQISAEAVGVQS
jgi:signal transduction histidine kinase